MGERARLLLFTAASALIAISAFASRAGHDTPLRTESRAEEASAAYTFTPRPSTTALMAALRQRRTEISSSARRFLAAFFHYEVGETGAAVRRGLWATSTRAFYRQLMRQPVAPVTAGYPARASLERLRVSFVSSTASRALVSGTANRGGLPEEFSFVFTQAPAGWLASAPGE